MARTQAADYEHRREAIVERAAALFAARGFHGASMAELAAVCEMSKSLLYHYYASKDDLLYEVMLSHVDQLVGDVEEVMRRLSPPTRKLEQLIKAFMRHYVGAADRQKVLLNDLDNLPAERKATIVVRQRTLIDAVQALLAEIAPGRDDPARQRVRTMLLFGMINWTHIWFDPAGPVDTDELADMAIAMALH
jgi:AcrR family transcriptional regulator